MRFTVDGVFVLLAVSWAVTDGDGDAVDVDGEIGPKFTVELVLLLAADDDVFNVESVSVANQTRPAHTRTHTSKRERAEREWEIV